MLDQQVAAVILAGGASRRMGEDKALLQLPDGRTALQAVLDAAGAVTTSLLLAVDTEAHAARLYATLSPPYPRLILDSAPGAGPLSALAGAMRAVSTPLLLVLAVDTPLVQPALLRLLSTALDQSSDLALGLIHGMPQPLPACYATRLAGTAEKLLRAGRADLRALREAPGTRMRTLDEALLRAADPDLRSYAGANTPEEWSRLLAGSGLDHIPEHTQPLDHPHGN